MLDLPLTAENLADYFDESAPGRAGPNQVNVFQVTVDQWGLTVRYPTVGDIDTLRTKTTAAVKDLGDRFADGVPTHTQLLNFMLYAGDLSPTVQRSVDTMPADLKAAVLQYRGTV